MAIPWVLSLGLESCPLPGLRRWALGPGRLARVLCRFAVVGDGACRGSNSRSADSSPQPADVLVKCVSNSSMFRSLFVGGLAVAFLQCLAEQKSKSNVTL